MSLAAPLTRHLPSPALLWGGMALLAGLGVALLPLELAVALAGLVGLGLLVLIEPVLGFILMLAVAPFKTLIETELGWPLPVDVGQLSLGLAVGAWALNKVARRQRLAPHGLSPLLPGLAAYLLVTGFTLPGAYSLGAGLREWLKWAEMALLVVIGLDFARHRWRWLLLGVVLAGVIQALIGFYEFRGGSGAAHLWILDFRFFRAFGTFGQPNPFGAFMGLVLPLALGTTWGYLAETIGFWRRRELYAPTAWLAGLYGLLSGILLLGLLVSWSRGAWLGFGAAALVMLWLLPAQRWQGTLAVLGLGAAGGGLYGLGLLPASLVTRVLSFTEDFTGFGDMRGVVISDENFAVVERLAHWQAAFDMAATRPWLGVGFGNYEAAYPDFALPDWPLALGHAHNYYINLLAETGIFGLLAYLLLWGGVIGLTWHVYRRTTGHERGIALGLMGVWAHLSVHSLVDKLYVNNLFLHIGVMLGLLAVLHWRTKPPATPQVLSEDK